MSNLSKLGSCKKENVRYLLLTWRCVAYRQVGHIRATHKGRKLWNPPESKNELRAARLGIRAALTLGSISHGAPEGRGGMEVQQCFWLVFQQIYNKKLI